MKVLVVARAGRGGIHQYAWQLCAACRSPGLQVTLACPRDAEALPGAGPERVVALGEQRGPRGYRALARELVALAPGYDLVHLMAPIWSPLDVAYLLGRLRPIAPLSCTLHELLPVLGRFYHRPVYRLYWQSFDAVAVHATEHERALRRLGAHRPAVSVVPFGDHSESLGGPDEAMDPRRVLALDAERPIVLFFGPVQARKGLSDLIRALAGTSGRVYLLCAGEPGGSVAASMGCPRGRHSRGRPAGVPVPPAGPGSSGAGGHRGHACSGGSRAPPGAGVSCALPLLGAGRRGLRRVLDEGRRRSAAGPMTTQPTPPPDRRRSLSASP